MKPTVTGCALNALHFANGTTGGSVCADLDKRPSIGDSVTISSWHASGSATAPTITGTFDVTSIVEDNDDNAIVELLLECRTNCNATAKIELTRATAACDALRIVFADGSRSRTFSSQGSALFV